MARPKALISWSSGKDSAFALHEVLRAGEFDVVGALTTVTETFGRVSIHGVRQEILQAQCEAARLPQRIVPIPYPCPNEVYEARMGEAVAQAVADGVTHMIFGDLFLADIRAYREQKLAGNRMLPPKSFPVPNHIWPAARAAAVPPEEPPGVKRVFHGLRVTPNTSLYVLPPAANSGMFDFPMTSAPHASRRCTTMSDSGDTRSAKIVEPIVQRTPSTLTLSLTAIGSP